MGTAYWLGHSYKDDVTRSWLLRRKPALVENGKAFVALHGGKAILIARFTPGVRAVVPLTAGILGMAPIAFYSANILSAAVWGPSHVAIGIAVGSSFSLIGSGRGHLAALVLVLFVVVCVAIWVVPRVLRRRVKAIPPSSAQR